MKRLLCVLLLSGCAWGEDPNLDAAWSLRANALGAGGGSVSVAAPATADGLSHAPAAASGFSDPFLAFCLAEAANKSADPTVATRQRTQARQIIEPYLAWLEDHPRLEDVHGMREPVWLRGEAARAALVLQTLIELDRGQPVLQRRDQIAKFAQGLALLDRPDYQQYPFGAHTTFNPSRSENPGYAPVSEQTKAPGAIWRPERSYQVKALASAAQYLGDKSLLEEAQTEALGIWTHLVVSDRWVWGFVPRPTGRSDILGSAAAVDNLLTLSSVTQQPLYATMAELAGTHCLRQKASGRAEQGAQDWVRARLQGARTEGWRNVSEPVTYKVMEAEDGRAVQKAFDVLEVSYPDGEAGKMVRVGRDQMFWMRFDIEREDDYFFYLTFLKSQLEGALVSVMMRIDGDKIFQVNLGGASDAFVDMDFVDGPRPLRAGPHSFGIRFAGLLMTQPAILDSVVAWPVVERRAMVRGDGRRALLLHNISSKPARTTFPEVAGWPPEKVLAVDRAGQPAQLGRESDRRRRKEYIVLPPGGVAWLEWQSSK